MAVALVGLLSAGTAALTGGALMGGFLVGGVGTFMTHFLVSTAMGAALNALSPKPNSGASGGYSLTGTSGSAVDHQIIYGKTKVGGVRLYDISTGGETNTFLHRILAYAGHEIEAYDQIYLNDELVTLSSNGNVTSPSRYSGYVRIKKYYGTTTQSADTDLVLESNGSWTKSHKLSNIAYLYVRLKYNADVFPNGIPVVSCVIKGKKVYDPSTSVTAWSDNPALCLRDYVSSSYGLDIADARISNSHVITAKNICNQVVESEARYSCNGSFLTSSSPKQVISDMLTSMGGLFWYSQGKWRMKASAYVTPTVTLDEDDLRSSISLSTRHSRRDSFNTVKGTFRGAESDWQPADYPLVDDSAFIIADNNLVNTVDFSLPFTTSSKTAQRIARVFLNRNREQLTISATFGLKAFQVEVGDVVYLNNTRFGWSSKPFEVTTWDFGLSDGLDLQTNLTLREISPEVFTAVDGAVFENNNTTLPSAFYVPLPSIDSVVVSSAVNSDGTTITEVSFNWSVTNESAVDYYDFQWKPSTSSVWQSTTTSATNFAFTSALSGTAYDYRVRSVNHLGIHSDFVSNVTTVSTVDDETIPKLPTGLVATAGAKSIKLTWEAPTENTDNSVLKDLYQHKIYRSTNNVFEAATLVGRISGDVFTDGSLVGGETYYYWVTALDYTGNESVQSNVSSAVATDVVSIRTNSVFYIGVDVLPTTSPDAHAQFVSVVGQPVDRDQAWFYTGTISSPTTQSVWLYEDGLGLTPETSWNYQEFVMSGDLLVTGSVTANSMAANSITATNGAIENLAVDRIKLAVGSVTDIRGGDYTVIDTTAQLTNGTERQFMELTYLLDPSSEVEKYVFKNNCAVISLEYSGVPTTTTVNTSLTAYVRYEFSKVSKNTGEKTVLVNLYSDILSVNISRSSGGFRTVSDAFWVTNEAKSELQIYGGLPDPATEDLRVTLFLYKARTNTQTDFSMTMGPLNSSLVLFYK